MSDPEGAEDPAGGRPGETGRPGLPPAGWPPADDGARWPGGGWQGGWGTPDGPPGWGPPPPGTEPGSGPGGWGPGPAGGWGPGGPASWQPSGSGPRWSGSAGRPAPGRPARHNDPRLVALLIGVAALVAILVRSGHLSTLSVVFFLVLVPSVVLHEVSHGWVADLCGDDTARRAGRLTLNPLAHVDLMGTIVVPIVMILSGVGAFGWAKPVPVNISRLRHPRNQALLVSLAGPATNIVLALIAAGAYRELVPGSAKLAVLQTGLLTAQPTWAQVVFMVGYVNVILAAFNLIPLPPLDGSAVLERLLPSSWLPSYYRIRPFTLVLPLLLIVLSSFGGPGGGILDDLFNPVLNWWGHVVGL